MKQFKGRIIVPLQPIQEGGGAEGPEGGSVLRAEALVSRQGFNTLASFQKALMFKDKTAACSDQNNPDLYGKPMAGKALCMPQTIGSTTGGMVLFCAAALESQPACLLFSRPIDSLAAAGAILAGVWTEHPMPTIDSLGEEFLAAVQSGATVTVAQDGTVTLE
jgi:predicted aconitase with swiveling domain